MAKSKGSIKVELIDYNDGALGFILPEEVLDHMCCVWKQGDEVQWTVENGVVTLSKKQND